MQKMALTILFSRPPPFFFQAEDGIRDSSVTGVQTCALPILDSQERAVKVEDLAGEQVAGAQVLGSAAAVRVGPGGDGGGRHHIFSRLTRKALNSGVREFASPTKGVSALASQYRPWFGSASAEMPT